MPEHVLHAAIPRPKLPFAASTLVEVQTNECFLIEGGGSVGLATEVRDAPAEEIHLVKA